MISFKTTVVVTPDAIRQIREKVVDHAMKSLILRDFETDSLDTIEQILRQAFGSIVQNNKPISHTDVNLSDKEVTEIAKFLKDGKKIYAIKAFRQATGKGLKDTKDFIDNFGVGNEASKLFIRMFVK
jgi:ribosomal protein L7/L12